MCRLTLELPPRVRACIDCYTASGGCKLGEHPGPIDSARRSLCDAPDPNNCRRAIGPHSPRRPREDRDAANLAQSRAFSRNRVNRVFRPFPQTDGIARRTEGDNSLVSWNESLVDVHFDLVVAVGVTLTSISPSTRVAQNHRGSTESRGLVLAEFVGQGSGAVFFAHPHGGAPLGLYERPLVRTRRSRRCGLPVFGAPGRSGEQMHRTFLVLTSMLLCAPLVGCQDDGPAGEVGDAIDDDTSDDDEGGGQHFASAFAGDWSGTYQDNDFPQFAGGVTSRKTDPARRGGA